MNDNSSKAYSVDYPFMRAYAAMMGVDPTPYLNAARAENAPPDSVAKIMKDWKTISYFAGSFKANIISYADVNFSGPKEEPEPDHPPELTMEEFLDELDNLIDDAVADDEGSLRAVTLLRHLHSRNFIITRKP